MTILGERLELRVKIHKMLKDTALICQEWCHLLSLEKKIKFIIKYNVCIGAKSKTNEKKKCCHSKIKKAAEVAESAKTT